MIISVPMSAAKPPKGPSSSRAIWPRLRPLRRVDRNRMIMSWTQPPSTGAYEDPQRAGQVAELGGQRRADQRAGAGDRGEVVAEHDPAVGRHEVAAVVEALQPAWRAWRPPRAPSQ